jgi:cytochrome c553
LKTIPVFAVLLLASCASFSAERPEWAFPVASPVQPPASDDGQPTSVPGSTQRFTQQQINDLNNAVDWFPDRHAPMPPPVAHGTGPALACAACHLTSGMGHPESSHLAGLPAAYLERQLADFKSGERKDAARMTAIGGALSEEDARVASEWFAALKPRRWIKVVEATQIPANYGSNPGRMRLPLPGGGTEALGRRIVELPQVVERAVRRDPYSGFIAYVPVGSVARGRALANGGGRTPACATCHGPALKGLNGVPGIAGASALYTARQLFGFQSGTRDGASAALMKPVAATLTDDDFINLSAFLASLPP